MAVVDFLKAVLGSDGYSALFKATDRLPSLETVIVPRTIVAWLGAAIQLQYEGDLPGVPDSGLILAKNESGRISGTIKAFGVDYSFVDESFLHVAARFGVAINASAKAIDPSLKGRDLSKLGKTIDLLVKGRFADHLQEQPLEKAIANIAPGKLTFDHPKGDKQFDYSHVLTPEHRNAGYSMTLNESRYGGLLAGVHHNGAQIGQGAGEVEDGHLKIGTMDIMHDAHIGKGLGSSMYEALMAHAKHHQGATHVAGEVHSSMASQAHQRLSAKHGMDYKPTPTPFPQLASPVPGPHDARHGPYNYAIKEELKPEGAPKRELQVSKSEAKTRCSDCGGLQFKSDKFVGCICLSAVAKSIKTKSTAAGYILKLTGKDWDEDSIAALIAAVRG